MTPEDVLARLERPLSLRRRLGYVALTLGGLVGAGLVSLLLATEPALPARTVAAFAVLALIGLAWATFGVWALTRRVPLYAQDRVVAGWLGLGAWGVLALGAAIIGFLRHHVSPALTLTILALGVLAAVNLTNARRRRTTLLDRGRSLSTDR